MFTFEEYHITMAIKLMKNNILILKKKTIQKIICMQNYFKKFNLVVWSWIGFWLVVWIGSGLVESLLWKRQFKIDTLHLEKNNIPISMTLKKIILGEISLLYNISYKNYWK